jgi:hypothetical protein
LTVAECTTRFIAVALAALAAAGCESDPSGPPAAPSSATAAVVSGASDGNGKTWRQLTETTGLTWTQVAQVCPRDGSSPCTGAIGTRDLNGWVWATAEQVTELFAGYEDEILTNPSLSGPQYYFTADAFLGFLRPTFSFAFTYSAGRHTAGWTASTDSDGAPIGAAVGNGHNMVSISGSFGIGPNPDEVSNSRGVFLWHADGSGGGNLIDAVNDAGNAPLTGGRAVTNVMANDVLAGAPASFTLTTLSQISSTDPYVTLDAADGSVDVAAGATGGVKQLEYRICESASPTNCDQATVAVTVVAPVIDAVNDIGEATPTGGTAVANVLANDRLDGAPATTSNVILSQVGATSSGITLDVTDGSVDVAAGITGSSHAVIYRICERASPSNCDQAAATVSLVPQSIVVSATRLVVKEGAYVTFTVRLSRQPAANVVVSVANFNGTATVSPSPAALTFTPANWHMPLMVRFQAPQDSDQDNNAATLHVSAPGIATVPVVARIDDDDRPAGSPMAILASPLNAQTLSGVVNVLGTGTDSNGQVVEARIFVDGDRIFRDRRTATTFTMNGGWDTRSIANGWHMLEFRVTDNRDNDGRMLIRVFVNN